MYLPVRLRSRMLLFLTVRLPPSSTRTDTPFPCTTLFRSRRNQLNIGVVGDLGTGKTQLLKSLIAQIASSGAENRGRPPRFLIFDYKRDYSSEERKSTRLNSSH